MTTKLLQHVEAMQGHASHYLEPGPYVDRNAIQQVGMAPEAIAFANDMLYCLDGPEQREAQFDYMAESARTASGHFHGDLVHMSHLADAFASFTAAAREIDRIKKLLFYGEDHAKGRYRLLPQHEHDRTVFEALGVITYAARKSDQEEMTPDGEAGQRAAFILHAILGVASEAGEQVEAIETTLATGKFDAEQVAAAQDMDANAPGYDPLASRRAMKDADRVKTQFEGLPVADTREGIGAQPVGTHGDPASPLGSRGYGE